MLGSCDFLKYCQAAQCWAADNWWSLWQWRRTLFLSKPDGASIGSSLTYIWLLQLRMSLKSSDSLCFMDLPLQIWLCLKATKEYVPKRGGLLMVGRQRPAKLLKCFRYWASGRRQSNIAEQTIWKPVPVVLPYTTILQLHSTFPSRIASSLNPNCGHCLSILLR